MPLIKNGIKCSKCSATETDQYTPFDLRLSKFRVNGWRIVKRFNVWKHFCPKCVKQGEHLESRFGSIAPSPPRAYKDD